MSLKQYWISSHMLTIPDWYNIFLTNQYNSNIRIFDTFDFLNSNIFLNINIFISAAVFLSKRNQIDTPNWRRVHTKQVNKKKLNTFKKIYHINIILKKIHYIYVNILLVYEKLCTN